jgi:hypothetical protein
MAALLAAPRCADMKRLLTSHTKTDFGIESCG